MQSYHSTYSAQCTQSIDSYCMAYLLASNAVEAMPEKEGGDGHFETTIGLLGRRIGCLGSRQDDGMMPSASKGEEHPLILIWDLSWSEILGCIVASNKYAPRTRHALVLMFVRCTSDQVKVEVSEIRGVQLEVETGWYTRITIGKSRAALVLHGTFLL